MIATTSRDDIIRLLHKGRRAEARGKFWERLIARFLVLVFCAFVDGWFLMFGVGWLQAHWWAEVPTMGYWTAVGAVAFLRGVLSRLPGERAKS